MLKVEPNKPDRACDNVLLEWCLAMELLEQSSLQCVLHIIMGKIKGGVIGNLFATGVSQVSHEQPLLYTGKYGIFEAAAAKVSGMQNHEIAARRKASTSTAVKDSVRLTGGADSSFDDRVNAESR